MPAATQILVRRQMFPIHWPPSICSLMRVTSPLRQRKIEKIKRTSSFASTGCPPILSSGQGSCLITQHIQKAESQPYPLCKSNFVRRIPTMTVVSSSPLHVPVHDEDPQSPPPCSALSPPFIENLASPFVPKGLEPSYPLAGSAFNFYDTFAIPPAPQWSEVRPRRPTGMGDENIDANLHNVLDPTTIFVGGLDVHGRCTWDEQRLKRVFGQYGEIAEVKLVRPGG